MSSIPPNGPPSIAPGANAARLAEMRASFFGKPAQPPIAPPQAPTTDVAAPVKTAPGQQVREAAKTDLFEQPKRPGSVIDIRV